MLAAHRRRAWPRRRVGPMSKQDTISEYHAHESDTGSPEVQIALLSQRISHLTDHLRTHPRITTAAAGC